MSTTPSTAQQMTRVDAPSGADSLQPNRTDFALLSPSARTSFTRVDVSAAEPDERGPEASIQVEQARTEEPHDTSIPPTPQVSLTFLLVSGRRRTMSFDPEITIGRVKELAWNAWPNDWQDERPPAPSYLRILYLGKILQDEDTLMKVGFPTHIPVSTGRASEAAAPTIVHLSVRPCPPSVKDAPKKRGLRRDSAEASEGDVQRLGCCSGCVVC